MGTTSVAFATQITQPGTSPFAIPGDVSATVGAPQAIDVVATGFTSGQNVFIEQCDGKDPSDATWSVGNDCDFGLAPSPSIADSNGTASFTGDGNNFQAFKNGKTEAQRKFNCIGADDPPTNNGLTDWTTCRIRVDVNPSGPPTGEQAFLTITLPDLASDVTTTTSTSSTSTSSTTVQQSPTCGLGAGIPQTVKPGQPPKPNKNIGTIKLSPGVTGTAATKAVTLKFSGTLDNCTGFSGFPNQKLPINGGSFTASIQVPAGSMCPSTFQPGAPLKGSVTLKWTGTNPKTGKPAAATATDAFKAVMSFTESSTSPLSFQLQTGAFTGKKSSFLGHSATMTFVVDQNAAAIATGCAAKGGLKLLNFTGVQGPSMIVVS
jgi:hypothetical protein